MPQNSARACVCVCVSVHMLERLIMQTLCYSCYVQLFQHNQSEQTAADIQLERLIRQTLQLLQLLCSVVPTQPKRANGRRHPTKCEEGTQTAADIRKTGPRKRGPLEVEVRSTNLTTSDPFLQLNPPSPEKAAEALK